MKRILVLFLFGIQWLLPDPASAQDLPEIGYFNLAAGGGKVYLAWQLNAGATCFGIQVHRSVDKLTYEEIGGIEGVCGDLNQAQNYSFIDENPPLNQRVYYRLELGTGNFTEPRYVDVIDLGGDAIQVRPNPVTTRSGIYFSNPLKEKHTLLVSDLQGKIIYRHTTNEDRFILHSFYFARGLYLLQITADEGSQSYSGKFLVLP
jgi:hypothetical protein